MSSTVYSASKTRTQGRPGWSISFRHPLRTDTKGKPGHKMRRGLGTAEESEADQLVAEMNEILSNQSWWNSTKRGEAERKFSPVIVAAFYDEIQAGRPDPWSVREEAIPLPTKEDGYSRVLFVGTTGAGKTTLLRHVIGSDPDEDRFPSTSTAKTTVSDIEVILSQGEYSAVVTFFSEFWVQANIEECVSDACSAYWEGANDAKIAERLLNHRDQRFRLSYSLGSWSDATKSVDEDDWSFGNDESLPVEAVDGSRVPEAERTANSDLLREVVARLQNLSKRVVEAISKELGEDVSGLKGQDRDAAQELFEEFLQEDRDFDEIVHDILGEVKRRFDYLELGELKSHSSGWPSTWTFETNDRSKFIENIRWFSSNYAPEFGRLLTPIVDGIRIRGPLFPDFAAMQPKLVLLDGQGLGHTPDSSASVTTQITRRFADVHVILLVDSAQQPMQAAPLSVVRAIAASGHQQKLAIAFTHFDQVKGVNLPTFDAKRAHVMASLTNGLTNLRDVLGPSIIKAIERNVEHQSFMLGGLDLPSKKLPKGVVSELERMLGAFERAIEPPAPPVAHPNYNPDGLVLAVQAAARGFQRPWMARLGLGTHERVHKEHWTRIKALNRRIAGLGYYEYDTLRPVADLVARLSEEVSRFLDNPVSWEPRIPNEEEAEAALSEIRKQVFSALHVMAERRLVDDHLALWRSAFDHRGRGSTFERAQDIGEILENASPIPSTIVTTRSAEFLREMRHLVHSAVVDQGGKFIA